MNYYYIIIFVFRFIALQNQNKINPAGEWKKQVPVRMAVKNIELLHECSRANLRMGTVRLK